MNTETWERDGNGELVPHFHTINVNHKGLETEIKHLEIKLNKLKDEKEIEVHKLALKLLKEDLKEKTESIEILWTPLVYYEIQYINLGLGLEGKKVHDVDAQICSIHCKKPLFTYEQWRDMKDPLLKFAISSFIMDNCLPKREKSKKEVEAFRLLQ